MALTSDHRSHDRYIASVPLAGAFGAATVSLLNLSDQGACIEHAQPLRLATTGRLTFRFGSIVVAANGIVVWGPLSETPNEKGEYLYHSGVRIEENIEGFAESVRELISQRV